MAIGPVQLIVLGFKNPDFHGEIIAELERLRESDTVRVIDALAVYKDADGEIEVEHLSNLSKDEAIELGSKIGALIGLGIEGEEGLEAGAAAGAEAAAEEARVFSDDEAWDVLGGDPERLRRRADPDRAPLGGAAARRDRPRRRVPHQRRVHQPARPRRDRPGDGRGGEAGRACHGDPLVPLDRSTRREDTMFGARRVARRTGRRTARRTSRRR